MKIRVIRERSLSVLTSSLAMISQRLPFLKTFSPFFGSLTGTQIAAPMALSFVGTQTMTGQSSVTIEPIEGSPDPATGTVGENFIWTFRTNGAVAGSSIESIKIETLANSAPTEGIPAGLSTGIAAGGRFGYLGGVPEEAGTYLLLITAYDEPDYQGYASTTYYLIMDIEPALTPFRRFQMNFWSGDDLSNQAISSPNADPDGDGIDNVLEFILDLDPTRAGVMPGVLETDPDDDSMLRYAVPLNELAADANVIFEESTTGNPADWTPVPEEQTVRTATEIVLTTPRGPGRKLFRLKVTL